MSAKKENSVPKWVDPDEIPDLSTPEWEEAIASGVVSENGKVIRAGLLAPEKSQVATTVCLDVEVIEHFKADGPGWQTRINAALLDWISLSKP